MAWASVLTDQDIWSVLLVLTSAGIYLGALLSIGTVLFRFTFPELPDFVLRSVRRAGVSASAAALALIVLKWPLQAGYLGGGTLTAATDSLLLMMVVDGAFGVQLLLIVGGIVLLQPGLSSLRPPNAFKAVAAVCGCLLVVSAFVQVGHTVREPRSLLAGLLIVHLLGVAYWLGAIWPLYRLSYWGQLSDVSVIMKRFGQVALFVVVLLVLAGATLAWHLVGGIQPLFTTEYGQVLVGKVAIVGLLLAFAAMNKFRLVPALESGESGAARRLRRSIQSEMVLAFLITLMTAFLASLGPPAS